MAKSVTSETLGAWLLKCNPDVWDVVGFRDDGEMLIPDWSVTDNYRGRMMAAGDPVVFWVTGTTGDEPTPGIWGIGHIVGPARYEVDFGAADDDGGYWLDEDARLRARFFVPTEIILLDTPVPRAEVAAHPALSGMEILQQAQMSNPSFLTATEFAALKDWFDWPPVPDPEPETLAVTDSGAGFGDPLTNTVVEAAAMGVATEHFSSAGWTVEDVSVQKLGWDLTCTRAGGTEVVRVEVKGVSGDKPSVLLTANELAAAKDHPGWSLAVVTEALTTKKLRIYPATLVLGTAQPYVFKAELPVQPDRP